MDTAKYHKICQYLEGLVRGTEWEGHLYAVGGCCRDAIMGLPIQDVDIAVDLPDGGIGFAMWLHSKKLTVGVPVLFQAFGTAKLKLKKFPDEEIEMVQTRREKYTDRNSRNPETAFGTLAEDCERRDLTINSLYYDIARHETVDVTGKGVPDIHNHVIRTPMDPDTTFDDDPVRILRCIRFACRYGWEIEPETYAALCRNVERLEIIKVERLRAEFEKMLVGPDPVRAMELMRESGALKFVYPELYDTVLLEQGDAHPGTVWQHSMDVLATMPPSLTMRMGALLHDIGKTQTAAVNDKGEVTFPEHENKGPHMIRRMMSRLKYRHAVTDEVTFLTRFHLALRPYGDMCEKLKPKKLRQLQRISGSPERFERLMQFIEADNATHTEGHRRPQQVEIARMLSEQSRRDGTAMFTTESENDTDVQEKPKKRRRRYQRRRREKVSRSKSSRATK